MEGVALIAEFEGCKLKAYRCPAGVWTCGWGETDGVGPRAAWTQQMADQRLCDSIAERADAVLQLCTVQPTANQLAALVSLAYNIGNKALAGSSVLKAHNRGDFAAAARAFSLWNKARIDGVLTVLAGLTRRRAAEAALYLKPEPDAIQQAMPQAVADESKLSASPIATSGGAAAGVGALALVSQAGDQVQAVATVAQTARSLAVDTLGIPPAAILPLVLIAAGGAALYWRHKQRRDGWA